jgi:hypothetical protein
MVRNLGCPRFQHQIFSDNCSRLTLSNGSIVSRTHAIWRPTTTSRQLTDMQRLLTNQRTPATIKSGNCCGWTSEISWERIKS